MIRGDTYNTLLKGAMAIQQLSRSIQKPSLSILLLIVCSVSIIPTSSTKRIKREVDGMPLAEDIHFFYNHRPTYPRDCSELFQQCGASNKSGVYIIQPHGYFEPFEVYCSNEIPSGGWTLILRRLDGTVSFNRHWNVFKSGFGFLTSEFWLGNDKISYLTNQAVYELRIDMLLSNGSSLYVNYKKFRVTDEWGNYTMVEADGYNGNTDAVITQCQTNMVYGNSSCTLTCADPYGIYERGKDCAGAELCTCIEGFLLKGNKCVPPQECSCYVSEENVVITNGHSYINQQCTNNITCIDDELVYNSTYSCDSDATCKVINSTRKCYCNRGYEGNGESCSPAYRDCNDALSAGNTEDGLYTIQPTGWSNEIFQVYCNMTIDGGGWTVFQRRTNGDTNFTSDWDSYRNGFGDLTQEFWLGNEKLYYLTNQAEYELRIDIVPATSIPKYAKYYPFSIDDEHTHYSITDIENYSGDAGDGLSEARGFSFSTFDSDNDRLDVDCVDVHHGAWWHGGDYDFFTYCPFCDLTPSHYNCQRCTVSNLNGDFNGSIGQGVWWHFSSNCHLVYTEMKIRRIQ